MPSQSIVRRRTFGETIIGPKDCATQPIWPRRFRAVRLHLQLMERKIYSTAVPIDDAQEN